MSPWFRLLQLFHRRLPELEQPLPEPGRQLPEPGLPWLEAEQPWQELEILWPEPGPPLLLEQELPWSEPTLPWSEPTLPWSEPTLTLADGRSWLEIADDLRHALQYLAGQAGITEEEMLAMLVNSALAREETASEVWGLWNQLTRRQQHVAWRVRLGLSTDEIAQDLNLDVQTVRGHIRTLNAIFGAANRTDLKRVLEDL